jgi:hypothetical protein
MSASERIRQGKFPFREMTVAQVRERKGLAYLEVAFLESARFYKLFRNNPSFNEIVQLLRDSLATGLSLRVACTTLHGDVIDRVQLAGPPPGPSPAKRHG